MISIYTASADEESEAHQINFRTANQLFQAKYFIKEPKVIESHQQTDLKHATPFSFLG